MRNKKNYYTLFQKTFRKETFSIFFEEKENPKTSILYFFIKY